MHTPKSIEIQPMRRRQILYDTFSLEIHLAIVVDFHVINGVWCDLRLHTPLGEINLGDLPKNEQTFLLKRVNRVAAKS